MKPLENPAPGVLGFNLWNKGLETGFSPLSSFGSFHYFCLFRVLKFFFPECKLLKIKIRQKPNFKPVNNRSWWPSSLSRQQCSHKLAAEDPGSNPRSGLQY